MDQLGLKINQTLNELRYIESRYAKFNKCGSITTSILGGLDRSFGLRPNLTAIILGLFPYSLLMFGLVISFG